MDMEASGADSSIMKFKFITWKLKDAVDMSKMTVHVFKTRDPVIGDIKFIEPHKNMSHTRWDL